MWQAVFFDLFQTLIENDENTKVHSQSYRAIAGGRELLTLLRQRGLKTAIISNITHRSLISTLLKTVDPEHCFDIILTSGEVGCSKPDPRIFRRALLDLHLDPKTVLHIGDDPYGDVLGAAGVGITPIWFNPLNKRWPYGNILPYSVATLHEVQNYLRDGQGPS